MESSNDGKVLVSEGIQQQSVPATPGRPGMKRCRGESSGNEEFTHTFADSGNSSNSAAMAALDNHLILQEIFKYLSPGDLRICCQVREKWRAIAGPMIFEYHLRVGPVAGNKVQITTGYLSPQIEERDFSRSAETEYLETLKRGNCFLSLEYVRCPRNGALGCYYTFDEFDGIEDFVREFRFRVYKFTSTFERSNFHDACQFSSRLFWEQERKVPYLPNCEEYYASSLESLEWFIYTYYSYNIKMPKEMNHLRKIYLGEIPASELFRTEVPTFLEMIPNLMEIHGVPVRMIRLFEKVKKVHLIRSVRFVDVPFMTRIEINYDSDLQMEAVKTMVKLAIKFKFLRIEVSVRLFVERNMQQFEDLLEIGKDTLQHLVIVIPSKLRKENYINFPATMSALTHLTLKQEFVSSSTGHLKFRGDFNFSVRFPKLTTISFSHPITLEEWKTAESWWKIFGGEFSKGIRHLQCTHGLSKTVEKELLERFPSVNHIDYVSDIDETDMDGIVSD